MTIKPNISLTVSVLIFIGFAAVVLTAQPSQKAPSRDYESLRSAFVSILLGAKKAGGSVVINETCGKEKTVAQPNQPSGSPEDPFDFITRTNPGYRVIKDSESVNLLPADYEPEILQTPINYYLIDSDKSAEAALYELLALNEVKHLVDVTRLNKGYRLQVSTGPSAPPMPGARKFEHLYNVTLREALNDVAVFYRNGIWAYTEYRCDGEVKSSLSFQKG